MITFECLFGGNYLPSTETLYSIYWTVKSYKMITVDDTSDEIGYVVTKPSQHCTGNNKACCRFISSLQINTSVVSVPDESTMTCNALYSENFNARISSLSEFAYYKCIAIFMELCFVHISKTQIFFYHKVSFLLVL